MGMSTHTLLFARTHNLAVFQQSFTHIAVTVYSPAMAGKLIILKIWGEFWFLTQHSWDKCRIREMLWNSQRYFAVKQLHGKKTFNKVSSPCYPPKMKSINSLGFVFRTRQYIKYKPDTLSSTEHPEVCVSNISHCNVSILDCPWRWKPLFECSSSFLNKRS